jgi:hypothetical protein
VHEFNASAVTGSVKEEAAPRECECRLVPCDAAGDGSRAKLKNITAAQRRLIS